MVSLSLELPSMGPNECHTVILLLARIRASILLEKWGFQKNNLSLLIGIRGLNKDSALSLRFAEHSMAGRPMRLVICSN